MDKKKKYISNKLKFEIITNNNLFFKICWISIVDVRYVITFFSFFHLNLSLLSFAPLGGQVASLTS